MNGSLMFFLYINRPRNNDFICMHIPISNLLVVEVQL
jgi:hypothetical protein